MTFPADLQPILDKLLVERDEYAYTGNEIAGKTLICLIAPSAVGKSTVISEILRQCADQGLDAAEVASITTRNRRPDGSDPINYRTATEGVTHRDLIEKIERYELINWSLSPTGDLYATDVASYPATYNFLPLQPDSLEMLERAGFESVIAIYLTAPPEEWKVRLADRRDDPKFRGRIIEAINSLEFAKAHINRLTIVNNPATIIDGEVRPTAVAQIIINLLHDRETIVSDSDALSNIEAMLAYVKQLQEEIDGTTA